MPTKVYRQYEADKFITGKHVDLVVVQCTCGLLFGIPDYLNRSALAHRGPNGWQISCPLGHTWHYTEAYVDAREQRALDEAARLRAELDQSQASLRTTKGVVTKLKKRASAGVCPCCNRTFQQLARHMAGQHPDFDPQATSD